MRWFWAQMRRYWPPGVRLQLTFVYAAGFAIIAVMGIALTSILLNVMTLSQFDSKQDVRVTHIAQQIDPAGTSLTVRDAGSGVLLVADDPAHHANVYVPGDNQTFVRILDLSGNELYHSQAFSGLPVSQADVLEALQKVKPTEQVAAPGTSNVTLRVLTVALVPDAVATGARAPDVRVAHPQFFGVLQVGYPLTRHEIILSDLRPYLPYLLVLGFGLSAIGGYALAARVFRPIKRLTNSARAIAQGDLAQRVPVPLSHDDVHALAVSFNDMAQRLGDAFTRQRRFIADASHELRTPVAAIRSLSEVALIQEDHAAAVQALQAVHKESERLGRLISDLLMLVRADDQRLQLDRDHVRLDLLAADAVASMCHLAEERAIALTSGPLIPVAVVGDAARLIQVMLSLIDNALTYTPAGGAVNISVTAPPGHACFSVHDTGIGISLDDLPHIFERFYRGDEARWRAAGGTGLGLALAQDLVQAHGGTILVESAEGQGTTFTVVLPAMSSDKEAR